MNHLLPVPDPHEAMPLDYFVWLLRGPDGREVVVDTGFNAELAERRGRKISRSVAESLIAMGTDPGKVSDVVITISGISFLSRPVILRNASSLFKSVWMIASVCGVRFAFSYASVNPLTHSDSLV